MFEQLETDKLLGEIERYLAAVAEFRALGCEPAWRPEGPSSDRVAEASTQATSARIAH